MALIIWRHPGKEPLLCLNRQNRMEQGSILGGWLLG
jgi:hypothetical protein